MTILDPRVARTFLFVPGHRADRFDRAYASGAAAVIIDLEDAVAPEDKGSARTDAARWLAAAGPRALVRVNAVGTRWFADDVAALAPLAAGIMLPKTERPDDVAAVHEAAGRALDVVGLVESATGLAHVSEISRSPGLIRLALGNVDLAAGLGVDPGSHLALQTARSALVHASAAALLPSPIDGVTTALEDEDRLRADSLHAREMGFGARLCIHPRQLDIVDECLRPTSAELEWAVTVLASASDSVSVHDGQMIDEPVLLRARRLLAQAGSDNAAGGGSRVEAGRR